MATALFVCLHNAGRSQMSAALFERAARGRHQPLSAGTTPADHVHPEVVQVMNELGIDLAGSTPRRLTRDHAEQADVVVPWAAATNARTFPASATSTGSSTGQRRPCCWAGCKHRDRTGR
jgi:arsenate reductase (thioredoxin)